MCTAAHVHTYSACVIQQQRDYEQLMMGDGRTPTSAIPSTSVFFFLPHHPERASMAFVNAAVLPRTGLSYASTSVSVRPATAAPTVHSPLDIRAAKHVQFKGTKKAYRTRPKKHRPSDINRKPPPFNPEPLRAEGCVFFTPCLALPAPPRQRNIPR